MSVIFTKTTKDKTTGVTVGIVGGQMKEKRIPPITEEMLEEGHKKYLERCHTVNPNSMLIWFPKIMNLGIPIPKTIFVPIKREEMPLEDEPLTENIQATLESVKLLADDFGYPVFIRSDLASGKHSWKDTCFVQKTDEVIPHVRQLCYEHELWDLLGLNYQAIAIREFLQLETAFTAFSGNMPINKEYRFFVRNGNVQCYHFYWPEDAFDRHIYRLAHDPDWKTKLAALNHLDDWEHLLLEDYAKRAGTALGGYWSVDFAKGKNGTWYLIDMAVGENSYHWPTCQFCPPKEEFRPE